jgi:hypothetical protein
MFAIIAAILFALGLLLDLIGTGGQLLSALMWAGLLALALHFALGTALPFRRQP